MFPEPIAIGPVSLHMYGVMLALGVLAGVILSEWLHRKEGGKPGRMVDVAVLVVLAGMAGARIVFVLINWDYYAREPLKIFMFWEGGLVFFGGLLGGGLAFILAARRLGLSIPGMLDIGAAGVCLAHAFGRLGCFSAGCCHGKPTHAPWAVTFTDQRCLATEVLNIPVHPTQLYSSLFLFGLTLFLVWLYLRRGFQGQVAAAYLILYGLFRFGVEFFRGDPRGEWQLFGATLSTGQWMAIAAVAAGAVLYGVAGRRVRKGE